MAQPAASSPPITPTKAAHAHTHHHASNFHAPMSPQARDPLQPADPSLWEVDAEVSVCNGCRSSFGFLTRRHHCRQCGRIFCSRCSQKRWPIQGITSRVCDSCHTTLSEAQRAKLKQQQLQHFEKPAVGASRSRGPSAADASSVAAAAAAGSSAVVSASAAATARTAQQLARESVERVIYHTASLCPKCSLLEKRGFDDWKPAQLLEQYRGIWLRLQCERHGPHVTLVCKERNFWWRCYSFQEVWNAGLVSSGLAAGPGGAVPRSISQGIAQDMEDLGRMFQQTLKSSAPPVDNLPMSFELALFADGQFVPDAEVDARLIAFISKWPANGRGSTFLLKLIGGLVERADIPLLNAKILRLVGVASTATPNPLAHPLLTPALVNVRFLVDVSYERLVDLLQLDNSVFLKVRVLPCVRYFLGPGEEDQFERELRYLVSLCRSISDLELVLSLSLDKPYPDLGRIFAFIKQQQGIVRFIMIQRERSPREILNRLQAQPGAAAAAAVGASSSSDAATASTPSSTAPSPDLANFPESNDPYELLEQFESSTGGLLRPSDFVPLSLLQLLEPVALSLGYGQYHLNPAPFCAFMATLVSTDTLHSVPLTRLFDLEQLYAQLVPVAQKLKYQDSKGGAKPSIGLAVAKQVQRALRACAYNVETPDVVSYVASGALLDSAKSAAIQRFVRHLQVVVVHNKMDFAAIDMHRRCRCSNLTASPLDPAQQIATCTGCV